MFIEHLLGTKHCDWHSGRYIIMCTHCFLIQHFSLQLSFTGTSQSVLRTAAIHQTLSTGWLRELPRREIMNMHVFMLCLLWGAGTPDVAQFKFSSRDSELIGEKVIWYGLKHVAFGKWLQWHSANEERRKPGWVEEKNQVDIQKPVEMRQKES